MGIARRFGTVGLCALLVFILFASAFIPEPEFLEEQLQFERVRKAKAEKESLLEDLLKSKGYSARRFQLLMVAYKEEGELELYVKAENDMAYTKLISYAICAKSGELGPKRRAGDYQVPEGFYEINRFNPASSYYLSLGLNYPNAADRKKSKAANLGGDIFIHGQCVTIGCMPMTNDKIKEIYLLAVYAKNAYSANIPVYVFPFKMSAENFAKHKEMYGTRKDLIQFWINLKKGYDLFMKNKATLKIKVDEAGDYVFL